eukprot:1160665-Pelagomonas_calceolata.AAC.8
MEGIHDASALGVLFSFIDEGSGFYASIAFPFFSFRQHNGQGRNNKSVWRDVHPCCTRLNARVHDKKP